MASVFRQGRTAPAIRSESKEVQFSRVLDECLEEIRAGRTRISECLARHPEFANDLAPLLETARAVQSLSRTRPSPAFRQATRSKILGLNEAPDPRNWVARKLKLASRSKLWVVLVSSVVTLLSLLSGSGIFSVYASYFPVTPLSFVKRSLERIPTALGSTNTTRADALPAFIHPQSQRAVLPAGHAERSLRTYATEFIAGVVYRRGSQFETMPAAFGQALATDRASGRHGCQSVSNLTGTLRLGPMTVRACASS